MFSAKGSFINKTAIIVHALFASLIIFQSITMINDATEMSRTSQQSYMRFQLCFYYTN